MRSSNSMLPILLTFWVVIFMLLMLSGSARAQLGYEPGDTVAFDWIESRGSDTVLPLEDDDWVQIPFNVRFYGEVYSRLRIGSNGQVYFRSNNFGESYFNQPIPSDIGFNDMPFIAGLWDDLNPEFSGLISVGIRGREPNRQVVIWYDQVPHYQSGGAVSFQVVLYEDDNRVLVQYRDVVFGDDELDHGALATVGLQRDAAFGQQYSFHEPVLRNQMAILWTLTQDGNGACTASEFVEPHRPGNVRDGDLETRWTAEGDGQWLQCDIGQVAVVNTVSIAWHRGDERRATFDIEVSEDGDNWTRVLRRVRSSGSSLQLKDYDFPHLPGRYVRLVAYGNTQNNFNSVTEFAIQSLSASSFANDDVPPANVLDGDFDSR